MCLQAFVCSISIPHEMHARIEGHPVTPTISFFEQSRRIFRRLSSPLQSAFPGNERVQKCLDQEIRTKRNLMFLERELTNKWKWGRETTGTEEEKLSCNRNVVIPKQTRVGHSSGIKNWADYKEPSYHLNVPSHAVKTLLRPHQLGCLLLMITCAIFLEAWMWIKCEIWVKYIIRASYG